MVTLDNTAVSKHDQLVGWFNHKESLGVLWILNEILAEGLWLVQ